MYMKRQSGVIHKFVKMTISIPHLRVVLAEILGDLPLPNIKILQFHENLVRNPEDLIVKCDF